MLTVVLSKMPVLSPGPDIHQGLVADLAKLAQRLPLSIRCAAGIETSLRTNPCLFTKKWARSAWGDVLPVVRVKPVNVLEQYTSPVRE